MEDSAELEVKRLKELLADTQHSKTKSESKSNSRQTKRRLEEENEELRKKLELLKVKEATRKEFVTESKTSTDIRKKEAEIELLKKLLAETEAVNERYKSKIRTQTQELDCKVQSYLDNVETYKIDLCILMDCTTSMDTHIRQCKKKITEILEAVRVKFPKTTIRFAFVGYRDFCDEEQFTICSFTENALAVREHLKGVKAQGGGDIAEDVHGGLEKVLEQNWTSTNKVLIHFADSPAHGSYYNNYSHNQADFISNNDPNGERGTTLMKQLNQKNIQYVFCKLNDTTDLMIRRFKSMYNSFELSLVVEEIGSDAEKFLPVVLENISNTVQSTIRRTTTRFRSD